MGLRTQPGFTGAIGYLQPVTDLNGASGVAVVPAFVVAPMVITATGIAPSITSSSSTVSLPNNSAGITPSVIRLVAAQPMYVRFNASTEAGAVIAAAGVGNYATADTITLTGGTFSRAMVLTVATTRLITAAINAAGTAYVPADTITLAGGTFATAAIATVATTKAVSATVNAGGTGGTTGTQTVTGTTGTGTKFQASVTVAGGAITAVLSITVAGSYTVNPTDITQEPVTGASLSGAKLSVIMGAATVTVSTPGSYTVNATAFTQSATSGSGTGATLNTAVYGVNTVTVSDSGDYSVNPTNPVSQGSTSGTGTGATFTLTFGTAAVAGDMLIPANLPIFLNSAGFDQLSAIAVSTTGILQISPVEG